MKRILLIIITFATLITQSTFTARAQSAEAPVTTTVQLDDGSYLVTTLIEEPSQQISQTRSSTTLTLRKTITYYNSKNVAQCALTLEAKFLVNQGSSVSCTSTTYQSASYDNNWSVEDVTTSANNSSTAQASGTASGKFIKRVLGIKINTVNTSVTITCDKNGNYW